MEAVPGRSGYGARVKTVGRPWASARTAVPVRGSTGRRGRRWAVDASLTVGLLTVCLALGHDRPPEPWRGLDPLGYLLAALTVLPVLARRSAPWTALVMCCAAYTALMTLGFWPVIGTYGTMLAGYSVAAYRGRRGAVGGTLLMAAMWVYGGLATPHSHDARSVLIQAVVVPPLLSLFGLQAFQLDDRNRQLATATEQLKQEQADRAQHAVTAERLRIARELHDVLAHHLSVVSVQAGLAGYVFDADPVTARAALTTIARTSAEALEETRGLLQVLRPASERTRPPTAGTAVAPEPGDAQPGAETASALRPLPGLPRVEDLVDRMRAAGLDTRLLVSGQERPSRWRPPPHPTSS